MRVDPIELAIVRQIRPRCSDCRSRRVMHGPVSELVVSATPEQLQVFAEGLEFVGKRDALAWMCQDCDGLGVFGDFEVGP